MQTTLFISPGACSFGSIVALEWANKPYKICITTPELRATPEFKKINPLGRVGALQDENNLIYENAAILLHLVDKYKDSTIGIPLNSSERIETYKWLSYLSSTLHTAFGPLFAPTRFVSAENVEAFKSRIIENLQPILTFIDTHLATNKYFVGNKPSVVDAQAYGLLRWRDKFATLPKYENISRFMTEMQTIPAVQNALNIEQSKTEQVKDSQFSGYFNL